MKYKRLILIALIFLTFSCKKDQLEIITDDEKTTLLELVNDIRQKGCNCGDEYMPPVNSIKWNDTLQKAAQIHSDDMAENNFFEHAGSDGKDGGYRIESVGYIWSWWGENIYKEQSLGASISLAKNAFNAWLNSAGHCKNMMNSNFTDMGVAKNLRRKNNTTFWTQNFATHK